MKKIEIMGVRGLYGLIYQVRHKNTNPNIEHNHKVSALEKTNNDNDEYYNKAVSRQLFAQGVHGVLQRGGWGLFFRHHPEKIPN